MKGWPIPAGVGGCLDTLRRTGHAAYPVGGCVRDLLLGRTPGDFDVCTDARPERVMELFPHTVPTGLRHGTVTVRTEDGPVEVTTFRREAGYADGTQDTVYLVQRYCRLSGAGGAKAFGRGLARRLWLLEPEEYTVLKETPDTLVLANYEDGPGFHQTLLLVVDGPDVLFLHYWGGGARSADVGAAAQARFAEYTAAARGR